jgi:hypothetical protein
MTVETVAEVPLWLSLVNGAVGGLVGGLSSLIAVSRTASFAERTAYRDAFIKRRLHLYGEIPTYIQGLRNAILFGGWLNKFEPYDDGSAEYREAYMGAYRILRSERLFAGNEVLLQFAFLLEGFTAAIVAPEEHKRVIIGATLDFFDECETLIGEAMIVEMKSIKHAYPSHFDIEQSKAAGRARLNQLIEEHLEESPAPQ